MEKTKSKEKWDKTRVVEKDLLVSRSPVKPILHFLSKVIVGLILSCAVFTLSITNNIGFIFIFHSFKNLPNITQPDSEFAKIEGIF